MVSDTPGHGKVSSLSIVYDKARYEIKYRRCDCMVCVPVTMMLCHSRTNLPEREASYG